MARSKKLGRVLFYAHYNEFGRVDDYVAFQLQQIRPLFDTVVVISNSPLSQNDQDRLNPFCDRLMQRPNIGYDFAAWRDGMNALGWDDLLKYDEVTVMNDTCFGPLFDFGEIYQEMQSRGPDYWGITTNIALTDLVIGSDGKVVPTPAHLQSYYMTFNSRVVLSPAFGEFWRGVKDFTDAGDVIANYEIGLAHAFGGSGFEYAAYFDAVEYWSKGDMTKYNAAFACPLWLLQAVERYPFVKTKAVRLVPEEIDGIRAFVEAKTNFPVQLIDSYIGVRYTALWKQKDAEFQALVHSKAFKLGHALAAPARLLSRR